MSDTLSGVIIGSLITSIAAVIVPWFAAWQQAKQHRRDLAVQIALELWRRSCVNTDAAKANPLDFKSILEKPARALHVRDPEFSRILVDVINQLDGMK